MTLNKLDYQIHTSIFMLQGAELYSGGENDPLLVAEIDAVERLAFDNKGNRLEFSLSVSIFGQEHNRSISLFEDKELRYRQWDQKIAVHVIVFNSKEAKEKYELSDVTLIQEV